MFAFYSPQNKPDIILYKRESASRIIKSSIDVELSRGIWQDVTLSKQRDLSES